MARSQFSIAVLRTGVAISALAVMGVSAGPALSQATVRQQVARCDSPASVTTGPRETAEIILADGSSVIVAPGGHATVGCDPEGRPSVSLSRGLIRVAGRNVTMTTPLAQLSLVSGAAIVEAGADGTRAHLLNGEGLRVSSRGSDRLIYRPGFQVVATDSRLTQPRRIAADALIDDILRLSEGLRTGIRPGAAQQPAPVGRVTTATPVQVRNEPDPQPRVTPEQRITPPEPLILDFAGGLTSGSLSPTTGAAAGSVNEQTTVTVDGRRTIRRQNYYAEGNLQSLSAAELDAARVHAGPTTNRLFGTTSLSFSIDELSDIGQIETKTGTPGVTAGVVYYYSVNNLGGAGLRAEALRSGDLFDDQGLVRLQGLRDAEGLFSAFSRHDTGSSGFLRSDTTFGHTANLNTLDAGSFLEVWSDGPDGTPAKGVLATGLQYGTNPRTIDGIPSSVPERNSNFVFIDMRVVEALNWMGRGCGDEDSCRARFEDSIAERLGDGKSEVSGPEIRAFRAGFFSFRGETVDAVGTTLIHDPAETRRYVFATGELDDVATNRNPGRRIDSFYLSPGMEGAIATAGVTAALAPGMDLGTGSRAFLRAESWSDLAPGIPGFGLSVGDLSQTPLFVAYSGRDVVSDDAAQIPDRPKLFYADLGFAAVGGRQVTTISATIGEVRFRYADELNGGTPALGNQRMVDATLEMHTVGSSRGLSATGASNAAIGFSGAVRSTSAGGGNTNLDADDDGDADPGRLGFFVLENAGRVFDDVEAVADLQGGLESPLGGTDSRYALLRLGVATGSTVADAPRGSLEGYRGFAAAILDVEGAEGVSRAAFGHPDLHPATRLAPNLSFDSFDATDSNFELTLGGFALGGSNGESAYIDRDNFGARSRDDSDLALIGGTADGFVAQLIESAAAPGRGDLAATMSGYDHVQWGFFFGDMPVDGQRGHAAMGTWAGGAPYTVANPGEVTATYRGHAIGNVAQGDQMRTAVGGYEDSFDFARREGRVTVSDFDGLTLRGNSSSRWDGGMHDYAGTLTGGGVTGELNGMFVGGAGPTPSGVVGAFSMTDGLDGGFRAIGTFVGERTP